MIDPPKRARTEDAAVRRWFNLWIVATTTFGVSGLLQWMVLPPGGTLAEIAKSVEIAALVVTICCVLRWAVLRERERRESRRNSVGGREP
jgi:hypothetical protein